MNKMIPPKSIHEKVMSIIMAFSWRIPVNIFTCSALLWSGRMNDWLSRLVFFSCLFILILDVLVGVGRTVCGEEKKRWWN